MGIQIAIAFSEQTARELETMGFVKKEVYIKQAPAVDRVPEGNNYSAAEKSAGDAEFFGMQSIPYQFVTTSFWGAGPG